MTNPETKATIYLAEDEDDSRFAFQLGLEMNGYEVIVSKNGEEMLGQIAEAQSRGTPIDLIITDLQMPGVSGKELIDRLLRIDNVPPILVISGFQEVVLAKQLMQQGCSGYISKPFTIDSLVELIEDSLRGSGSGALGENQGGFQAAED